MADSTKSPGTEDIAERTEGAAAMSAFGVDARSHDRRMGHDISRMPPPIPGRCSTRAANWQAILAASGWVTAKFSRSWAISRFTDEAWQENGIYRRIGQSYTAWTQALDHWLDSSGLEGIERDRARFVLNASKDLLAPVNTLVGNPEALRRVRKAVASRCCRASRISSTTCSTTMATRRWRTVMRSKWR